MDVQAKNGKQDIEIAVLNTRMNTVEFKLDKIMENHLPHIQAAVNAIRVQLALYAGGIVVAVWLIEHFFQ